MRVLAFLAGLISLVAAAPAAAQVVYPPADTSSLATKSEVAAVQATVPVAASTVPPMETVGGAVGTAGTYRPGTSVQPRITRAGTCTISGGAGACSGTWSTPFPSGSGINVIFTPVNTGAAQPIACNLTATPDINGYAAKCWIVQNTTLTIAIVTTGLNLAPAIVAPNGTVIQVTGLPQTQ